MKAILSILRCASYSLAVGSVLLADFGVIFFDGPRDEVVYSSMTFLPSVVVYAVGLVFGLMSFRKHGQEGRLALAVIKHFWPIILMGLFLFLGTPTMYPVIN
jgi:hypothetical protein